MKHVCFTFLCVLLALFESYDVFAQLMTYSGEFARGKATYTYLTDGEERIYNGGFNYISTDGKHKIKGQFKDDLKEGEWVTEWNGFEERANYLSGKKHGDYSVFYKDDNYYLTYKGSGMMAREEYNLPLNEESYYHLLEKADGIVITKKRYVLPLSDFQPDNKDNLSIELDIFEGKLAPLIIAEIEFPTEEMANSFIPPEIFAEDVTFDPKYHNSNLSKGT